MSKKSDEDDVRDVIEELQPESILPAPPNPTGKDGRSAARIGLDTLFTGRGVPILSLSDRVPNWWSPERDKFLWRTVFNSDVFSSAIFSTCARLVSAPVSIVPRSKENRNHRRIAMWSELLLQYYWVDVAFQFAMDWQCQDNGAFLEIMGGGDPGGPIEPTAIPGTNDYIFGTGLRSLDSQKCTRTGDPEYPVVYRYRGPDNVEKFYKFHNSRIIFSSQMPSPRQGWYGVGYSGASRAIHNILRLDDIRILEEETMGVRPASQLIFAKGMSAAEIENVFDVAEQKANNSDKTRATYRVYMGVTGNPEIVRSADLTILDLKHLPEGYDPEMNMNLAMNVIAMALGFDSREFWPATVRGATRADAEVQDRKAQSKTHGIWRAYLKNELDRKWCPATAIASFDRQDDDADQVGASIAKTRAETRKMDLESGALDLKVAWQQMLENQEITEEQYNYLIANKVKMDAEAARQEVLAGGQDEGNKPAGEAAKPGEGDKPTADPQKDG